VPRARLIEEQRIEAFFGGITKMPDHCLAPRIQPGW
jgi:hypothetical protein